MQQLNRARAAGEKALRMFSGAFPEGSAKAMLRVALMRVRGAIPRELLVNPGEHVVQVGTPQVRTIRRLSALAGSRGRVVVIEPNGDNQKRITGVIDKQGLTNVTLVPKGAWKEKTVIRFLMSSMAGGHRIDNEVAHDNDDLPNAYVRTENVEVDQVDNILDEVGLDGTIGYTEVAVNGAELEVLQGMSRSLPRIRRMFVKAHGRHKETGRTINEEVAALLRDHGFRVMIGAPTITISERWGRREGDVLAWRD